MFLSATIPLVAANTPEGNAYLGKAQSNDKQMSWRESLFCLSVCYPLP